MSSRRTFQRLLTLAITLATLLLLTLQGHRAPEFPTAPHTSVALTQRAPAHVATCRVRVVERVQRGIAHRVLHDRARALHDREADEAIVDDLDDDLGDGREGACDTDSHGTHLYAIDPTRNSQRAPRYEPSRDPSRFAAACGLARGPPVQSSFHA